MTQTTEHTNNTVALSEPKRLATSEERTALPPAEPFYTPYVKKAYATWGEISPAKRGVVVVAVLLAAFFGYRYLTAGSPAPLVQQPVAVQYVNSGGVAAPLPVQPAVYQPVANAQPVKTTTNVSESHTMVVQSVGRSGARAFLNSNANYKDSSNFTIVLEGAASQIDVNGLKGKNVTATGIGGTYQGRQQIVVTDPNSVRVQ